MLSGPIVCVFKVRPLEGDNWLYVRSLAEVEDHIKAEFLGATWQIFPTLMTAADFDALPEFSGF